MKPFKQTILIALASCAISTSWAYEARVVGVSDGDTVTVLDVNKVQHKIRVAGIDAPEKKWNSVTAQKSTFQIWFSVKP